MTKFEKLGTEEKTVRRHDIWLQISEGQSVCLIEKNSLGPKQAVPLLNSVYC